VRRKLHLVLKKPACLRAYRVRYPHLLPNISPQKFGVTHNFLRSYDRCVGPVLRVDAAGGGIALIYPLYKDKV